MLWQKVKIIKCMWEWKFRQWTKYNRHHNRQDLVCIVHTLYCYRPAANIHYRFLNHFDLSQFWSLHTLLEFEHTFGVAILMPRFSLIFILWLTGVSCKWGRRRESLCQGSREGTRVWRRGNNTKGQFLGAQEGWFKYDHAQLAWDSRGHRL